MLTLADYSPFFDVSPFFFRQKNSTTQADFTAWAVLFCVVKLV